MAEIIEHENRYIADKEPFFSVHENELMTRKAILVFTLLEKWGMVQGFDNGEDSAGRAKNSLMPVDETVNRAIEMVEEAWDQMLEMGWILECQSHTKLREKHSVKEEV